MEPRSSSLREFELPSQQSALRNASHLWVQTEACGSSDFTLPISEPQLRSRLAPQGENSFAAWSRPATNAKVSIQCQMNIHPSLGAPTSFRIRQ